MMDESDGGYVEARNFFRTIQHIPLCSISFCFYNISFFFLLISYIVINSGLLTRENEEPNYSKFIEKINTLLFEQIVKEELYFHKFPVKNADLPKGGKTILKPPPKSNVSFLFIFFSFFFILFIKGNRTTIWIYYAYN